MPKIVKMGLSGTGFLGHKQSHDRALRRRLQRSKVLKGFPVTSKFESYREVEMYFSTDKLVCLLCGQEKKKLGVHILKLHGVTCDQYRERYGIPWTYGLVCRATFNAHSDAVRARMMDGWKPPDNSPIGKVVFSKRRSPVKEEVALMNLGDEATKPRYPLQVGLDGKLHTKSEIRRMAQAPKGSPEYHEKLRNRPRSQKQIEMLTSYWRGRKQSEQHKAKRFAKNGSPAGSQDPAGSD